MHSCSFHYMSKHVKIPKHVMPCMHDWNSTYIVCIHLERSCIKCWLCSCLTWTKMHDLATNGSFGSLVLNTTMNSCAWLHAWSLIKTWPLLALTPFKDEQVAHSWKGLLLIASYRSCIVVHGLFEKCPKTKSPNG